MSATHIVKYADRGFWAYDVAVGVLLKYLLDAAQKSGEAHTPWLSEAMSDWRVWAVFSDYGFTLDERWSAEDRKTFIALAEQACAEIGARNSIPAEEVVSWPFVDDLRIFPRGAKEVFTAPVVELGRAMVALLLGELPEAPKGEAWFFGTPDGRSTIRMSPSWDGRWNRIDSTFMRPRYLLPTTIAMGILSLTSFLSPKSARYLAVTLWTEILIVFASYLVLWFFWKGKNWARISVLVVSVVSVINLISLIYPKGNVIVYDSIVIAWALVGLFLLYWLNLADVREWFKNQKKHRMPLTPNAVSEKFIAASEGC